MFTQFDEEQQSKTKISLYDVLSLYIQIYQNIEVRINDMLSQPGILSVLKAHGGAGGLDRSGARTKYTKDWRVEPRGCPNVCLYKTLYG